MVPGCGQQSALTSLAVLGPPAARAQVKLEYKFPEGKKRAYKTTSKTAQVLTLNGQEIATESKQTVISSSTVGKRRADNTLPIEEKVESLATEITLPGGIIVTFDSKDPNPKVDNPQLGFLVDVFKLVSEIGYTVVLDDHDKVKAVEGAEKILEKAEQAQRDGQANDPQPGRCRALEEAVRAVPRQPAGRPGPARRALGAGRGPEPRSGADPDLPQEI